MDAAERRIIERIEAEKDRIIAFADDIYRHPELGFKETRSAAAFAEALRGAGLEPREGLALTGVKATLEGSGKGPAVVLVGELDAVRSPAHPNADPSTGAAHACGHHAQLAGVYGAALALSDPEVRKELGGDAVFFAVPAEEYGEIEFKNGLRKEGKLEFLGGKAELIRLGEFDDAAVAIVHHSAFGTDKKKASVGGGSSNGFIGKRASFIGREAHAAAAPHEGINALNAAVIGLSALNAQRETFKDSDAVRVHPIITRGGDLVNVIPGQVDVELLVRARTNEAILDASAKATRAFEAGAHAVGAEVEIVDLPGYLPRLPEPQPSPLASIAAALVGEAEVELIDPKGHFPASTDVGDLTHVMPVLTFGTAGLSGSAHSADVRVLDADTAYVLAAKIFALGAYALLKDGAALASKLKAERPAKFTKDEYVSFLNSIIEG